MKKTGLMVLAAAILATQANAGEYKFYAGGDYVNSTYNVSGIYPDNYDIANVAAGINFVDVASLELFLQRSLKEKETVNGITSHGKTYGYGADLYVNAYNLSEGAILGSVGYGRIYSKLKYTDTKKDTANTLRLGVGGEWKVSNNWGLRSMFRYSLAKGDNFSNAKEFTMGARYYFSDGGY
jgi:opacity protein-like surface antigen